MYNYNTEVNSNMLYKKQYELNMHPFKLFI